MGIITCEPKVLADALSAVKSAVSPRSPIQALAGVRITTNGNTVTLAATDMDLFIRRELPATVYGDVDICVSHAELVKVAKAFAKSENLDLTVVPRGEGAIGPVNLACASGARKIEIPGLRLEDFPDEPNAGGHEVLVGANGAELAGIIERAAKFASKDETRPVLTGIWLEAENDRLTLVATDSYRLCALTLESEPAWAGGFNVSARGLTAAAKLMRKEPAVTLRAYSPDTSVGQAIIEWPGTRVYSRLILGQYPNWRQLMPDTFPNEVVVPVRELRSACDVAVQFLVKNCPVRFYVNGVVKLHGHVPDGASVEEILPGAKANMEPPENSAMSPEFEIGLNPEFLRDIAHVLEGDHAVVKLISPLRPALIESQQGAEKYLIMPIRLNV